jgi:hypothetical protein
MRILPAVLLGAWFAVALNAGAQVAPTASALASASAAQRLPAELPVRRDADVNGAMPGAYAAWIGVLVVSVAGALLVRYGRAGKLPWARSTAGAAGGELRVIAVRALGPQTSLQVVEWNGKQLLLGCTSQSIAVLDVFADQQSKPAASGGAGPR